MEECGTYLPMSYVTMDVILSPRRVLSFATKGARSRLGTSSPPDNRLLPGVSGEHFSKTVGLINFNTNSCF